MVVSGAKKALQSNSLSKTCLEEAINSHLLADCRYVFLLFLAVGAFGQAATATAAQPPTGGLFGGLLNIVLLCYYYYSTVHYVLFF